MLTFNEAKTLLETARAPEKGKPLCSNTRLFRRGNSFAIRLHETDVVLIHPDLTFTLNTGGWRTRTTKSRLNQYSPSYIYQSKKIWYLAGKQESIFYEGMKVGSHGNALEPRNGNKIKAKQKKLDKLVSSYKQGFKRLIEAGKLEDPSGGDCWFCALTDSNSGKLWGDADGDVSHIMQHLREKYYVSSLLFNAIKEQGHNMPALIWSMIKNRRDPGDAVNALNSFFRLRNQALLKLI